MFLFLMALVLSEANVQDVSTGQPVTSLHNGKKCVYDDGKHRLSPEKGNDGNFANSYPNIYHSCVVTANSGPIVYTVKLKNEVANPTVTLHARACCNKDWGGKLWFYLGNDPIDFEKDSTRCKVLFFNDKEKHTFKCENAQGKYLHVVGKTSTTQKLYYSAFAEVTVSGAPPVIPDPPPKKADVSTGQPITSLHNGKKCVWDDNPKEGIPENGNDGKNVYFFPNVYHSCVVKANSGPIVYTVKLKYEVVNPDVIFYSRACCNNNFGNIVTFCLDNEPNLQKNKLGSCRRLAVQDKHKYQYKYMKQGRYLHVLADKGQASKDGDFSLAFGEVTVIGARAPCPADMVAKGGSCQTCPGGRYRSGSQPDKDGICPGICKAGTYSAGM